MKFFNVLNNLTNFLDINSLHVKERVYTLNQLKVLFNEFDFDNITEVSPGRYEGHFNDFKFVSYVKPLKPDDKSDKANIFDIEFILFPLFNYKNIEVVYDIEQDNLISVVNNEFLRINELKYLNENNIVTIKFY